MQARLRDPYDALGVSGNATPTDVRHAFLELTKRFHPARFGRMAPEVQRLANEVFLGLRAAHDTLARPTTKANRQSQSMPVIRPTGAAAPVTATLSPPPPPTTARSTGAFPVVARPAAPVPRAEASGGVPVQPMARTGSGPVAAVPRAALGPPPRPQVAGSDDSGVRRTQAMPVRPSGGGDDRELASVLELMGKGQWDAARTLLGTLSTRAPQVARYRALLAYARGREAQLSRRNDEARVELEQALQIDPDLQLAKTALAELFTRRK